MNQALSQRNLPWLIAGLAILILASAHILEAFGWPPCELCLRQRIPYWVGIVIAVAAGVAVLPPIGRPRLSVILMAGAALTFAIGVGLAVQHLGVEQGWWKSDCSTGSGSIEDMLKSVGPVVRCDEKRPFLFGLTLATYNIFISAALAALSAIAPLRAFRDPA